jgi:amidase
MELNMDDICELSARSVASFIRKGKTSSQEVVAAYLDRIDKVNPKVNAVVQIDRNRALEQAASADKLMRDGDSIGVLHGVPFTVKDNIETKDIVCACGTEGLRNNVPSSDATVVARMRAAGGILVGKTNIPEMGMGYETDNLVYGRTNNPYDLSRTSGGSSGGEAAILASGGSAIGVCTDGGGSARWPAHCCGLAGFKPTTGRTPKTGHVPPPGGMLNSLWQISLIGRYIEDIRLCLPVICGPDDTDSTTMNVPLELDRTIPISEVRIAYFIDNGSVSPHGDISDVIQKCVDELARSGASVILDKPPTINQSHVIYWQLMSSDGGFGVRNLLKGWGTQRMHDFTSRSLDRQFEHKIDTRDMGELINRWDAYRDDMNKFMQQYDAIVCPISTQPANKHGDTYRHQEYPGFAEMFSYLMAYNLVGWPCGTVRAGSSQEGLPVGVQVVAKPWKEDVVLSVLSHVERNNGWEKPKL